MNCSLTRSPLFCRPYWRAQVKLRMWMDNMWTARTAPNLSFCIDIPHSITYWQKGFKLYYHWQFRICSFISATRVVLRLSSLWISSTCHLSAASSYFLRQSRYSIPFRVTPAEHETKIEKSGPLDSIPASMSHFPITIFYCLIEDSESLSVTLGDIPSKI